MIGNASVSVQNEAVCNLDVMFDTSLQMTVQVNSLSRTCNLHLYNIRKVHRILTATTTHTMVRNLILSILDYCNALYGVSGELIRRLQLIQNSAARLITGTQKHSHITQDLIDLHWLPVRQRFIFKMAVLVF